MKKQTEKTIPQYHKEMLEAADAAIIGRGDGRISKADAEAILQIHKNNPGEVADRTLAKIMKTHKHTPGALDMMRNAANTFAMVQDGGTNPHIPDWNEAAEASIRFGLSKVPYVGEILSSLTALFWPQDEHGITSDEIWKSIQAKVAAAVEEGLDHQTWIDAQTNLKTLGKKLHDFNLLDNKNKYDETLSQFTSLRGDIEGYVDNYWKDTTGDDGLALKENLHLLPLFAKYATFHLSFLREAYGKGLENGMSKKTWNRMTDPKFNFSIPSLILSYQQHINDTMKGFVDYDSDSAISSASDWVERYNLYMSEVEMYNHYLPHFGNKNADDKIINPSYQVYYGPIGPDSGSYYHNAFKKFDGNSSTSGMLSNIDITLDLGYDAPYSNNHPQPKLKGLIGLQLSWGGTSASPMDCGKFDNDNYYKSPYFPRYPFYNCDHFEGRNKINLWINGMNPVVQVKGHFDAHKISNISFYLKDGTVLGPYGESSEQNFSTPMINYVDKKITDKSTGEMVDNPNYNNPPVLSSIIMNQKCSSTYTNECSGLLFGFRRWGSYSNAQKQYAAPKWDYNGVYKLNGFNFYKFIGADACYSSYNSPAIYEIDSVSPNGDVTGSFMDSLLVGADQRGMVPFKNGKIDHNTRTLKADNITPLNFTEKNGEILLGGLSKNSFTYHFSDWGGYCALGVEGGDVFHVEHEDDGGVRVKAWSPGEWNRQSWVITHDADGGYILTCQSAYAVGSKNYHLCHANGNLSVWEADQFSMGHKWDFIPTGKGDNWYYMKNEGNGCYIRKDMHGIYTYYKFTSDISEAVAVQVQPMGFSMGYVKQ